jgi:Big-like domain-containing protein
VPRVSTQTGLAVLLTAVVSLTCGEGAGPDPNAVAGVVITPGTGSLDTGDSLQLTAVAQNADGTNLSGKVIVWSTLDASLVDVGNSGLVHGRFPGLARVVATSEQRSDTASLQVIPKINRIVITPTLDTLTSLFDVVTLSVHAFIDSQPYRGGSYGWDVTNAPVGQLIATGPDSLRTFQAFADGATFVRAFESRGARDSARIVVRQRVALILTPQSTRVLRGCPERIHALAVDARNNTVPGAVLAWTSTDTTLARVDSTGLVTPLAIGDDTIVVSSQGVTRRIALMISAAATPTLQTSGVFAPVTTVGVGQYALAFGNLGASPPLARGRFRVVSSDTTILQSVPADTEAFTFSTTVSAGPVRLVGRARGNVTLTPYLCDVAGASVPFSVTRARLRLFGAPPSTARTDDPPLGFSIRTQDSTGAFLFPAEQLTVRITATDTNVIRSDSAYRHLAAGTDQAGINVTFADTGTARIVLLDSSGNYLPDSSSAVQVSYPPLYIFSEGGLGQPDTLHVGLRQKPFYDVYRARVGLDRFVTGAPLRVHVSISDSTIVRVGPDSLDVPVGESATAGAFDIAARDTRGTAIFTARAHRHMNDQVAIVVGRPAVQVSAPAGFVNYPGDPDRAVQVFAVDSATGSAGFPTENVTFSLTVSDTSVLSLDSTTLTVPAGDHASGLAGITLKKPGTATITATDPRVAAYSYGSATSAPVVIDEPYLAADSALSLGVAQRYSFGVVINGPPLLPGQAVHVSHTNPGVATLADTIASLFVPGYAVVGAIGVSPGVDTVIASAPGFRADTGLIVVGMGTFEVAQWPLGLQVNETRTLELKVFGPNGDVRLTAVTTTFTLAPNGNIEFFEDGVPVTSITFDAGQHFMQFAVKGKAAGTGTVTVSAPNYTPVTKTVTVAP